MPRLGAGDDDGGACPGMVWQAGFGSSSRGLAGLGTAWQARRGRAWRGADGTVVLVGMDMAGMESLLRGRARDPARVGGGEWRECRAPSPAHFSHKKTPQRPVGAVNAGGHTKGFDGRIMDQPGGHVNPTPKALDTPARGCRMEGDLWVQPSRGGDLADSAPGGALQQERSR